MQQPFMPATAECVCTGGCRRRTTSGTSVISPLAYPARPSQPYAAPPLDQSQRAAAYIEGIGWSTPAVVSPRVAQSGSGAVGSSPLGRQSSIMPDWSVAEDAATDQVMQPCSADLLCLGPTRFRVCAFGQEWVLALNGRADA